MKDQGTLTLTFLFNYVCATLLNCQEVYIFWLTCWKCKSGFIMRKNFNVSREKTCTCFQVWKSGGRQICSNQRPFEGKGFTSIQKHCSKGVFLESQHRRVQPIYILIELKLIIEISISSIICLLRKIPWQSAPLPYQLLDCCVI